METPRLLIIFSMTAGALLKKIWRINNSYSLFFCFAGFWISGISWILRGSSVNVVYKWTDDIYGILTNAWCHWCHFTITFMWMMLYPFTTEQRLYITCLYEVSTSVGAFVCRISSGYINGKYLQNPEESNCNKIPFLVKLSA